MKELPGWGSLRGRLALVSVAIAAVAVIALGGSFLLLLDNRLDAAARELLAARLDDAAQRVQVAADGTLRVAAPDVDGDDDGRVWVLAGREPVLRARGSVQVQQAVLALADRGSASTRVDGQELLLGARAVRRDGRQVGTVVTGLSLAPYDRTQDLVQGAALGLGLALVAGSYLATRLMVGRALRPVAQMTQQAADWSATDVERRFSPQARPHELARLAANLDALLDRQSAVLRHEQRLTDELSHELRTPLARILAEVELLQARPRDAAELAAGHAAIAGGAERMTRLLETLLTAGRVTVSGPPGRCDAAAVVASFVADVDDPRLTARFTRPCPAGLDADLLERIVAPLVDNALRHASSQVVVSAGPAHEILVRDDGPGLPDELLEDVFAPGRRGPGADAHPGFGLGLALSRRLARAAGGDVRLHGPAPGLTAVIDLPTG